MKVVRVALLAAVVALSGCAGFGDAGTAVEHAARVPAGAIRIPERQARYWLDVARAYHQWSKPAKCYQALLAAERHAPEEVHSRPAVRSLATDLLASPRQSRDGRRPRLRGPGRRHPGGVEPPGICAGSHKPSHSPGSQNCQPLGLPARWDRVAALAAEPNPPVVAATPVER